MAAVVIRGGKRLEQKLAAIARAVGARAQKVRVGFLEGATYPNGTPVAMVAAIQNFGAPSVGIPPRPFFTNMVKQNKGAWGKQLAGILRATDFDAKASLGVMGKIIGEELQASIIA